MLPTDKVNFDVSTEFKHMLSKSKSIQKISSHSIQKKSKEIITKNMSSKMIEKFHKKKFDCTTNNIQNSQGQVRLRNTTPEISLLFDPNNRNSENTNINIPKVQPTKRYSNNQIYQLLESVKLIPNIKRQYNQYVHIVKDHIQKLKQDSFIKDNVQNNQIPITNTQNKLIQSQLKSYQKSMTSFSEISPIKKLNQINNSSRVLYTNLNLQNLCEQSQSQDKSKLDGSDFDQIQYYKIMHMLGEKYELTPRKSQTSSFKKIKESQIIQQQTEANTDDSIQISQLNMQLQMIDNILKKNKEVREKKITPQKSLKKQKSIKTLIPKKKSTIIERQVQIIKKKKKIDNNIYY